MSIRQTACIYFAVQGIAVVLWWIMLVFVPSSRVHFRMGDSDTMLLAFWLPDLSLLGAGSLTVGGLCFFDSKLTPFAAWFTCGAIAYATFYCAAFAFMTDSGWLGVTLMTPAMLWSGVYSIALSSFQGLMFREAKPARTNWILTKTAIQIIIVWGLILFVFPYFIVQLEDKLGINRFSFPFQKTLSVILFVLISSLGLSGSYTMSRVGKGTPLPLDHAVNLVVKGIYSFVRNPMAISGVGQGLAVGLLLGSPLVLIYSLMGGLIWQFIFRPLEEEDLQKRFGAQYEHYCREIKCWIPRLKRYQMDATADSSNSIESPFGKT
jgi:protein-S-isoprenylcysteine O-methyltransferase Ste14